MKFDNVLVGSEDPSRLAEYYTKLFGEPLFSDGGYTSWQLGDAVISVGPHSEVHGRNTEPGRIILNITSEDVRGDTARWTASGATVVREPYEFEGMPGTWIATFEDPDGNYFQLMSPFDPSQG